MDATLDDLQAEAASIDAQAAPETFAAEPETPKLDVAAEVAALLLTAAGLLSPAFPSLGTIYTEPTCRRLGDAAAPVMEKYGLSVGGLFERWGLEITLAAVALPVALATVQGIRSDLAARKVKPVEPPPVERDVSPAPAA
jgi:hypothetical protein